MRTDLDTMEQRKALLHKTVQPFKNRAFKYDQPADFPFENFEDLRSIGYPSWTIPKAFGGLGISLTEMLKHQETIAKADGSTGLSIGWQVGLTKHISENQVWKKEMYEQFVQSVKENGSLYNNAATEPATGSPTRGGRPETTAKETDEGWVINGRKTFTTLAPILDFVGVTASIEGTDQVANFLVKRGLQGVKVEETWDSIAMRATGSHDLLLEDVLVEKDDLLEYLTPGNKKPAGWLLHIPACYLGIAKAAQEEAIQFAVTYSPISIKGTISEIPSVKQRLGEIELLIMESESILYHTAKKWDESNEEIRMTMGPELGAAKLSVVNKANKIVDLAMRVVGARSLSEKSPLQRYYRDVRAGLHNPPMDDMTIMNLANKSMKEHQTK